MWLVNKNFVVKNGIEVNDDYSSRTLALGKVGIGSTIPTTTLDVIGQGIKSQDGLLRESLPSNKNSTWVLVVRSSRHPRRVWLDLVS